MSTYVEMFPPTIVDIRILQGARYRLVISVVCDWETDLAGWTAQMEVRPNRSADAVLLADLSQYVTVAGAPADQVTVDIDGDASQIDGTWTSAVYDIEITPANGDKAHTLRVCQGMIELDTEVTR